MPPLQHQITIGSTTYSPADRPVLAELQVKASLGVPVHRCRIVLGGAQAIVAKPNDPVTVKIGYGQEVKPVFTGVVQCVEWGIEHTTIQALSAFHALTTAQFNLVYEKSNAGAIVKDVAQSRLKLKVKTIENGVTFPAYVLGDRISAYDHLQNLARQCGFDLYATATDQLVFTNYSAAQTHELTYGVNILSLTQAQPLPEITGVEIYGESPASQGQGDQAYAWLTKKEVKGTAGGGSGVMLRLTDPTARTQSIAGAIAQATLDRHTQKLRGQVRVLGDSTLQLGDAIKITKMPVSSQNGTFKITGVTHRLSRHRGFYTIVDWEKA